MRMQHTEFFGQPALSLRLPGGAEVLWCGGVLLCVACPSARTCEHAAVVQAWVKRHLAAEEAA